MRISILTIALLLIQGCASTKQGAEAGSPFNPGGQEPFQLRMANGDTPLFSGQIDRDTEIQQGAGMMYPGDSGAVFLASVLTHAALAGSMSSAKDRKQQVAANRVLEPYASTIELVTADLLLSSVTARRPAQFSRPLQQYRENAGADWVLETAPIFKISQDQRSIILKNNVELYSQHDRSKVIYTNIVEVVSDPVSISDPSEYWSRPGSILEVSQSMFSKSIQLVLDDISNGQSEGDAPERTYSYYQGTTKRFERGRLVARDCDRYTLRTLRGWIMSVPINIELPLECNPSQQIRNSVRLTGNE